MPQGMPPGMGMPPPHPGPPPPGMFPPGMMPPGMGYGAPQPAAPKQDADELLKEFLESRRKEREQETKNMIEEKKRPKTEGGGKGWRAGSPMSSAAKPTVPVHIGFQRQPPPGYQPPMMMGPPPEGGMGPSQQEVMSREGGGGFFFYPPGHPNHIPGSSPSMGGALAEGQLRSSVHPQERIAPHWAEAKFKAHGMGEVTCEARHATFGPLSAVTGRLVRANPPQGNTEIKNVDQVKGNIVYIKRGGCSFTKKARMAQQAGAIAMVVANTDRETFGMSFTDDGEPFDAIRLPCVMISSDVCEKLESCRQSPDGKAPWTTFLRPLTGKTDPAFVAMQKQMMEQQAMMGGQGGQPGQHPGMQMPMNGGGQMQPGMGPPPMMMPPPPPGGGQAPKKGIVGRLKSMLP